MRGNRCAWQFLAFGMLLLLLPVVVHRRRPYRYFFFHFMIHLLVLYSSVAIFS